MFVALPDQVCRPATDRSQSEAIAYKSPAAGCDSFHRIFG